MPYDQYFRTAQPFCGNSPGYQDKTIGYKRCGGVQHYGLVVSYRENEAVHKYIRQLMALPFLPAAHIQETFENLRPRAERLPQLVSLVDYIERQWLRNPVFSISEWSVFRHTIRTNNDVEGN